MLMGPFFCYRRKRVCGSAPACSSRRRSSGVHWWPPSPPGRSRRPRHPKSSLSSAAVAPQSQPPTPSDAGAAGGPSGDYVGSAAVQAMPRGRARPVAAIAPHPDDQTDRRGHGRRRFQRGTRLSDHGRSFQFSRPTARRSCASHSAAAKPETFRVDYTLGAKRYQGYLSKLPTAASTCCRRSGTSRAGAGWTGRRLRRSPTAPTICGRSGTPTVSTATARTSRRATTSQTKRYNSTWTEMGIGCEACHGPGRPHVRSDGGWEKNPASKPAYDNSAQNRGLTGILKMLSPRTADAAPHLRHLRLLPRQQDERLRRLQGRRSLRRLRAAVPDERRDPRRTICKASSGRTDGPTASTARRR